MAGLAFFFVIVPLGLLSLIPAGLYVLIQPPAERLRAIGRVIRFYGICVLAFFGLMIVLLFVSHALDPMTVDREAVIGTYRVDRDMFPGEEANWQHEHFLLTITEQDTVVLQSLDMNGEWHSFKRPIVPVLQGAYSYLWRFPSEGDSTAHHILANTPTLHRQRCGFYYTFPSPRFGNMFFRKED